MGWSVGYDENWKRDIGYGVPGGCDHPGCTTEINRGLAYVCGEEPYGGEKGCGLFFCTHHLWISEVQLCERCTDGSEPFTPSPDVNRWISRKLTDSSWARWRNENPHQVRLLMEQQTAEPKFQIGKAN
ncbi:hypothetical protein AB0C34_18180 [Nocardia sp. NPDC049220]|uniref:hypothetical protein n=1 Tax=Nocardia sp. NPDC049220 TaxID=3155273 RepID=UPI0033DBBB46